MSEDDDDSSLSNDFARFKIPRQEVRVPNEDKYIDITEVLFSSLKNIGDGKVVQSPLFDLLEGTRAVEVSNPKLDTGLIPLTSEDIHFDTALIQDLDTVVAIQDKLIQSYMSWLNSSTLPITVLSCRYVQAMLENYGANAAKDTPLSEQCSLVNARLPQKTYDTSTTEYLLVHKVLKSFTMGLCKLIDLSLTIARSVLYEDEDLTHRSSGLNFLSQVDIQAIKIEIKESIKWIKAQEKLKDSNLADQLQLVLHMIELPQVYEISINLFGAGNAPPILNFAQRSIELIDKLSITETQVDKIPAFTFSKFIQVDLDNNIIPSELYEIPRDEAWTNLRGIFTSIQSIANMASQMTNVNQFNNSLQFDIQNRITHFNVLVRGVFQLFLIRDNSIIFGSPDINLTSLIYHKMENVIGKNTELLRLHLVPQIETMPLATKTALMEQFTAMVAQLESAMYHNLTIPANNTCRQQQSISRALVIWDSQQVAWETFEQECFAKHQLGDRMPNGELGFSISSYVYRTKLQLMIQLALHGIELDLYRDYELYMMYWYTSYLIQISVEHLKGRVTQIIEGKIKTLQTLPANFNKLKGPKKDQVKNQIQYNIETVIPGLMQVQFYNTMYEVKTLTAQSDLMEAVRLYQIMLYSFDLIDYLKGPRNSLTSFEVLFNLRLKPWSSIGVPDVPSFSQYRQSLNLAYLKKGKASYLPLFKIIDGKLSAAREAFQEIVKSIKSGPLANEFLPNKENVLSWYSGLVKTCIVYSIEVKSLAKIVKETELAEINSKTYKLHTEVGYHGFFPIIKMKKREL